MFQTFRIFHRELSGFNDQKREGLLAVTQIFDESMATPNVR